MSKFMNGLLHKAEPEILWMPGRRKPLFESIGGDHACPSTQLGLAIDMGKNGDKEIHGHNGQHLHGVGRGRLGKPFEDRRRMVLEPILVQDKFDIVQEGMDFCRISENPGDLPADPVGEHRFQFAQGGNEDDVLVQCTQAGL